MLKFYKIFIPPIFPSTICLILGIYLRALLIPDIIQYLILISLIILYSFTKFKITTYTSLIILSCCITFTWGSFWLDYKIKNFENLNLLISENLINITGKVIEIEELSGKYKQLIKISAKIISLGKKTISLNKFLDNYYIYIYLKTPINKINLDIGNKIFLKNIYCLSNTEINFSNTFATLEPKISNSRLYNLRENILAKISINKFEPDYIIYAENQSLLDKIKKIFFNTKNSILNRLKQKMSSLTFTLFSNLFLGAKIYQISETIASKTSTQNINLFHTNHTNLFKETNSKDNLYICKNTKNIKNNFMIWGLSHYLARAGLHVIIFLMIWQAFLRLIPINFILKQIFLTLLLIFFWLLSWPAIPFKRAVLTFILTQITIFFKKIPQPINILSIICLLILVKNPFHLFSLDFQLSFVLTLALTLIH